MIYLDLCDFEKLVGINPNLDKAILYVKNNNLLELPLGRNDIHGENVYLNRISYKTVDEKDSFYEAHIDCIDVHIVLDGKEKIQYLI